MYRCSFCWWRHTRFLITSQWPDICDVITRIDISNSLDIDFINGDIHGRSCKRNAFLCIIFVKPFTLCLCHWLVIKVILRGSCVSVVMYIIFSVIAPRYQMTSRLKFDYICVFIIFDEWDMEKYVHPMRFRQTLLLITSLIHSLSTTTSYYE